MRRTIAAALCAALALSAVPAEAQSAAARASLRVQVAPVLVVPAMSAPALSISPALAAPAAISAPVLAAPNSLSAAPAAAVPSIGASPAALQAAAARPAAPAAAAPASAESAAVQAAALFDGAAFSAAAKDEEPVSPPPSARPSRLSDPSYQPRLTGKTRRALRGPRREPATFGERATAFAARLTGVAGVLGAWREGLLIQRHAARLADRTQSDAKRAASARMLAELGRVEAVPALGLAHESDPAPAVRRAALAALISLSERVEPRLIRRLKLSFFSVTRAGAADALGWIVRHADAPVSVDALSAAAQADRSEEVRLDAIESLGKARSPRAIGALEWLASVETRPRMRAAALTALAEARARLAAAGRAQYAPPPEDLPEAAGAVRSLALKRAVGIGLFFAAVEFAGSLWTGNLALRADALHLAGDRLLDATALFALWLGRRPPSSRRTYGFLKAEAVFAFLGSLAIAGLGLHMIPEAFAKLAEPSAVPSWSVVGFAAMSLASNLISAAMLFKQKDSHMGMKGAFLHMLTDAAGTFGVIAAAAAHILWGIAWLEPIVIGVIVFLILQVAWQLGKPAWDVLLDAVPAGVSLDRLEADLLEVPGVAAVYDLHVRSLTSSAAELSAKLYAKPGADHAVILASSRAFLKERYGIVHSTIQIEPVPNLGL